MIIISLLLTTQLTSLSPHCRCLSCCLQMLLKRSISLLPFTSKFMDLVAYSFCHFPSSNSSLEPLKSGFHSMPNQDHCQPPHGHIQGVSTLFSYFSSYLLPLTVDHPVHELSLTWFSLLLSQHTFKISNRCSCFSIHPCLSGIYHQNPSVLSLHLIHGWLTSSDPTISSTICMIMKSNFVSPHHNPLWLFSSKSPTAHLRSRWMALCIWNSACLEPNSLFFHSNHPLSTCSLPAWTISPSTLFLLSLVLTWLLPTLFYAMKGACCQVLPRLPLQ